MTAKTTKAMARKTSKKRESATGLASSEGPPKRGPGRPKGSKSTRPKVWIRQATLARITGQSTQTIYYAVRRALAPAFGGTAAQPRVDVNHPCMDLWLRRRGVNPKDIPELVAAKLGEDIDKPKTRSRTARSPMEPREQLPEDGPSVESLLDWTLRDITDEYGSMDKFMDHLNARRKIADARRLELANAANEGLLVPRAFVATHVVALIDATYRRLLSDTAVTIAARLQSMVRADTSLEELQRTTRDLIESQLQPLKAQAIKTIREGDSK